jgi:hypothetical protein
MPLDAPRRKSFLLAPGESLLIPNNAGETLSRVPEFARLTGLDSSTDLVIPTSTAIPLPVYRADYAEGHVRIPGWHAQMLWHPLAWLPQDFVFRYQMLGDDEESAPEPDELWAVRVCLTLQEHGLYDPTTGTWLDILSAFGLDVDDPDDLARVQAWTDGGDDELLDSVAPDVDALINDVNDDDWPIQAALAVAGDVLATSWGTLATSLKRDFDTLTEGLVDGTAQSVGEVAEDLASVATMASALLGRVPISVVLNGEPGDDDTVPEAFDYWIDLRSRLSPNDGGDVEAAVDELNDALDRIVDFSTPYRDSLYDFDNSVAEQTQDADGRAGALEPVGAYHDDATQEDAPAAEAASVTPTGEGRPA